MAYNNDGDRPQRQMFQGNWTCSDCGTKITELPFQPDADRVDQLKCRDCHSKGRSAGSNRGYRDNRAPREMHQGNWTCSGCGNSITELPFEPDASRLDQLKCRDCHRKSKGF